MKLNAYLSQIILLGLIALMGWIFVQTIGMPEQEMFLSVAAIVLIVFSMVLERIRPLHAEWNEGEGDTIGDVLSFVLIFGLVDGLMKLVTPFVIIMLLPEGWAGITWPLWMQILAVTLIIEFGAWASHWAHHRYTPLWSLHAMHHVPERLYTLNNFRFHPLNHIVNYLAMFVVPFALGFSTDALLGYAALSLPVLLLQHSNVGFQFGMLNGIFNTNELHRWHHSAKPGEGVQNLGRALIIWDRVFGTYHAANAQEPARLGLFGSSVSQFPGANRYLAQLAYPFTKACCRKA
ncbi:MAG: sterol desaturase family protein [Planktomarina sp.]